MDGSIALGAAVVHTAHRFADGAIAACRSGVSAQDCSLCPIGWAWLFIQNNCVSGDGRIRRLHPCTPASRLTSVLEGDAIERSVWHCPPASGVRRIQRPGLLVIHELVHTARRSCRAPPGWTDADHSKRHVRGVDVTATTAHAATCTCARGAAMTAQRLNYRACTIKRSINSTRAFTGVRSSAESSAASPSASTRPSPQRLLRSTRTPWRCASSNADSRS